MWSSTDRDSFVGQGLDGKNLCGAHMIGQLVPKRAVQASRSTWQSQLESWRHFEALVMPRKSARHKFFPRSSARSLALDMKKSCEHSH